MYVAGATDAAARAGLGVRVAHHARHHDEAEGGRRLGSASAGTRGRAASPRTVPVAGWPDLPQCGGCVVTVTVCHAPVPRPQVSRIFQELSDGVRGYHECLKMKDVPVPFAYVQAGCVGRGCSVPIYGTLCILSRGRAECDNAAQRVSPAPR